MVVRDRVGSAMPFLNDGINRRGSVDRSASCATRVEAPQRTRMRWQQALGLGGDRIPGASGRSGMQGGCHPCRNACMVANARGGWPKQNAPGGHPRAFAFLGDRRDRSPVRLISRLYGRRDCRRIAARNPCTAYAGLHRGKCATIRSGLACGRRVSWRLLLCGLLRKIALLLRWVRTLYLSF